MSKNRSAIIPGKGIPCPRCGNSTEIREHAKVTPKHLAQPYYYSRWFYCLNRQCKTTLIMRDEYRVFTDREEAETARRIAAIRDQLTPRESDPLEPAPWE